VRTVRNTCLDRLLVISRGHLEGVLEEYVRHYNEPRPHRGLQLRMPRSTCVRATAGPIRQCDILGGLIHEYEPAA
jgi:hypothetical protein